MNILTKTLVILLSLFSIFLCGTVVTYIGTAENYKKSFQDAKSEINVLNSRVNSLVKLNSDQQASMKQREAELIARIEDLQSQYREIENKWQKAERAKLEYESKLNSSIGLITGFEQTISNLNLSLENTQKQLDENRKLSIKDRQELNETAAKLYEVMVQMKALESDKKRILEDKTNLEQEMTQLLQPGGMVKDTQHIVTSRSDSAQPVYSVSSGADITGRITKVSNSLVSLSLGSADGIKKGMLLHVVRGDDFICDVRITDVDTDRSAGVLELVSQQPKIGDNITTKL